MWQGARMRQTPGTAGDRTQAPDQVLTIMVAAMAGALVLLGAVLVIAGAQLAAPPLWMLLVVTVATAGAWALAVLPSASRSPGGGTPALQALVVTRAAALEAPALIGLALAFVAQPVNLTVYLLPALFALAGMWLFARPGAVRARLARDLVGVSDHSRR
jgi:hypothetical protein